MGGGVGGTITVAEAGGKRRADDGGGRARVPVMLPLPLAGAYDYAVPPAMEAVPGAVVTVPLGPRVLYGVVWHGPTDGSVPASKLRPITSVVPTPPLRPALLRFIDWVADYTLSAPGEVLRMALPIPAATEAPRPRVGWRLVEAPPEGVRVTPERARVLAVLRDAPGLVWTGSDLARTAGVTPGVLRGGSRNCKDGDDKDVGPKRESGWWVYMDFTAQAVTWR